MTPIQNQTEIVCKDEVDALGSIGAIAMHVTM
jgi:hypothetical protein